MSRWGVPNVRPPVWLTVLLDEQPACFDKRSWPIYLRAVRDEAMHDAALRRRMERGGAPTYCEACQPDHRKAMHQAGRCTPLKGFEDA